MLGSEVANRSVERDQLGIIDLGDVEAETVMIAVTKLRKSMESISSASLRFALGSIVFKSTSGAMFPSSSRKTARAIVSRGPWSTD